MTTLSYAFDPTKGETPQSVAQSRAAAQQLAARIFGRSPQNVGEGLNAIGQAIIARTMLDDAGAAQKAGLASGNDAFSQITSAITGQPTAAAAPSAPIATPPMGNTNIPVAGGEVVPNDSNAIPGTVGMNQRLADLSQDFIQDNPGTYLSSGVRSTADQARLFADRANNPNPVAAPGTSRHERGLAVDIGGMAPEQRAMLPQFGLGQPVANDPPHVELASPAAPVQVASNDPKFAPAAMPQPDNAAIPPNAQPTQGTMPAASIPTEKLLQIAQNPWLTATQKSVVKGMLDQRIKAMDPLQQLQIQKLQSDLKERKTQVVGGRLVDSQTGEVVKDFSDVGPTPAGYKAVRGPEGDVIGMNALPGSEADQKAAAAQKKADEQKSQQTRSADVVTQDIDRALGMTKNATLPVTGAIGSLMSNIPGTASHDVNSLLSSVKANISFDRLQAMRAASPTGGALGSVSDKEGALLASAYGNLEQSQSQPQFERNLKRVKNIYLDIVHGPGNGPAREKIADEKPSATPDRSAIEAEMKKRGLL